MTPPMPNPSIERAPKVVSEGLTGEALEAVGAQTWDHCGTHLSAMRKIIRANYRGTGCRLSPAEVRSIDFAEGDGEWYSALKLSMGMAAPAAFDGGKDGS